MSDFLDTLRALAAEMDERVQTRPRVETYHWQCMRAALRSCIYHEELRRSKLPQPALFELGVGQ